jgi:hypothetical protein
MFGATLTDFPRLNGHVITVQQIAEGYEVFEKSWVGTDWPHDKEKLDQAMQIASIMSGQVISLTAMGSPALGLCNVAAGRLHAYWALELKIWDIAAAALILSRAGGTLTDDHGNSWLYSVAATSPAIASSMAGRCAVCNAFSNATCCLFAGGAPLLQHLHKLRNRLSAEVALAALADAYRACFLVAVADHQHVRNLLRLCIAQLGLHALTPLIHLRAESSRA